MKSSKKRLALAFALTLSLGLLMAVKVDAMHIMEGFLPKPHALFYYVLSTPFVIFGLKKLTDYTKAHPERKLLIALAGAFVFLLSSLKLPAMTGSCSHPTGVGLGTVIFGPFPMFVLGTIVLIFQALLLAHGGISTLGANVFSMAIAGPLFGYVVYAVLKKAKVNKFVCVFLAAALADLFTYVVTSVQLGVAFPGANVGTEIVKYLSIFAVTQIPIAIIEGILTALVYDKILEYEGGSILNEKFN